MDDPNHQPTAADKAELRRLKAAVERTFRRKQHFMRLARERPGELRDLLDRELSFDDICQLLPLPEKPVAKGGCSQYARVAQASTH